MPSESRLKALIEDIRDSLVDLSRGRGYWFDYGDVLLDCDADWDAEKDRERPRIFVVWKGPIGGNPITGNEQATGRFRRNDQFRISVAIKNDGTGTSILLDRIHRDLHKALFVDRVRGSTRVQTWDSGIESVEYLQEGDKSLGGVIRILFTIRWDHFSGDMTTQ